MKYDFIEIGTSDFRTLAHTVNGTGISIEPIRAYFERLPEREGLIKINCAISDSERQVECFYCDPEIITRWALPTWLRGCNSIEVPHPTVKKWCEENKFDYNLLVKTESIWTRTVQSIFEEYNIEEVDFLKVDTEGHDYYIMKSLFTYMMECSIGDTGAAPIINRIQYESNTLTTFERKLELTNFAEELGYTWKTKFERGNEDTILNLIP
jgi:FkbM family methyltransferase